MLILTRKSDEEIIINSEIKIRILSISENHVKLGISAPSEIEILRGEIYEKVKQASIIASNQSKQNLKDLNKLKINKLGK
jgi:carbon storage regulator